YLRRLYLAIADAGRDFGLVQFGMRALLSLRLEKNFPTWYRELRPIYGPFEAALERFVDLSKSDFIGREAALREKESGGKLRRVTFVVDATDADVVGDEPIWHDGKVIGWVTSGGYGHYVERSLTRRAGACGADRRSCEPRRGVRRTCTGGAPAAASLLSP
ncbi:MAG: aminomethyl transferase family protein, partial [Gammaproteobacteria bacterium]